MDINEIRSKYGLKSYQDSLISGTNNNQVKIDKDREAERKRREQEAKRKSQVLEAKTKAVQNVAAAKELKATNDRNTKMQRVEDIAHPTGSVFSQPTKPVEPPKRESDTSYKSRILNEYKANTIRPHSEFASGLDEDFYQANENTKAIGKKLNVEDIIPEYDNDLDNKLNKIKESIKPGPESLGYSIKEGANERSLMDLLSKESYRKMMGKPNNVDKIEKFMDDNPDLFASGDYSGGTSNKFWRNTARGTSDVVLQQVQSVKGALPEIATYTGVGAALGTAFATPTLGIAAPVTSTTGALLGFKYGMKTGAAKYMYQVEAGLSYNDMIKEGIPHEIAKPIAMGVGAVNGLIETVQLGRTIEHIPGLDEVIQKVKKEGLEASMNSIKKLGLTYAGDLGKNIAEELAQENVGMLGKEIAQVYNTEQDPNVYGGFKNYVEKVKTPEWRDIMLDVAVGTAESMWLLPGLSGAGGVAANSGMRTLDNAAQKSYNKKKDNLLNVQLPDLVKKAEEDILNNDEAISKYNSLRISLDEASIREDVSNKDKLQINKLKEELDTTLSSIEYRAKEIDSEMEYLPANNREIEDMFLSDDFNVEEVELYTKGINETTIDYYKQANEYGILEVIKEKIISGEENVTIADFILKSLPKKERNIINATTMVNQVEQMMGEIKSQSVMNRFYNISMAKDVLANNISPTEVEVVQPTNTGTPQETVEGEKVVNSTLELPEGENSTESLTEPLNEVSVNAIENDVVLDENDTKSNKIEENVAEFKQSNIVMVPTNKILVDPERYQFRYDKGNANGADSRLASVESYNEKLAGVLLLRQDEHGDLYVINGHNRKNLADKFGIEEVKAEIISYKDYTDEEARALGAMLNIGDNNATEIDVAKVLRDSSVTMEELKSYGISPKNKLTRDGMALAQLDDWIFRQVATKAIAEDRAIVIGRELGNDKAGQRQFIKAIDKIESKGKTVTASVISEMIAEVKGTAQESFTEQTLLGETTTIRDLSSERGSVVVYVKEQLRDRARVLNTVSKEKNASILKELGNKIAIDDNIKEMTQAEQALWIIDKTLNYQGTKVNELFNRLAKEFSEADYKDQMKIKKKALAEFIKLMEGGNLLNETINPRGKRESAIRTIQENIEGTGNESESSMESGEQEVLEGQVDLFGNAINQLKAAEKLNVIVKKGTELWTKRDIMPIVNAMKNNIFFNGLEVVFTGEEGKKFWTREDLDNAGYNSSKEGIYTAYGSYRTLVSKLSTGSIGDNARRKDQGDSSTDRNRDIGNTFEASSRIELNNGATKDTILHEMIHFLQDRMDVINPDTAALIRAWEKEIKEEAIAKNIPILDGKELLVHALLHGEFGYAKDNPIGDLISVDNDIVEDMKAILGKDIVLLAFGKDKAIPNDERALKAKYDGYARRIFLGKDYALMDDNKAAIERRKLEIRKEIINNRAATYHNPSSSLYVIVSPSVKGSKYQITTMSPTLGPLSDYQANTADEVADRLIEDNMFYMANEIHYQLKQYTRKMVDDLYARNIQQLGFFTDQINDNNIEISDNEIIRLIHDVKIGNLLPVDFDNLILNNDTINGNNKIDLVQKIVEAVDKGYDVANVDVKLNQYLNRFYNMSDKKRGRTVVFNPKTNKLDFVLNDYDEQGEQDLFQMSSHNTLEDAIESYKKDYLFSQPTTDTELVSHLKARVKSDFPYMVDMVKTTKKVSIEEASQIVINDLYNEYVEFRDNIETYRHEGLNYNFDLKNHYAISYEVKEGLLKRETSIIQGTRVIKNPNVDDLQEIYEDVEYIKPDFVKSNRAYGTTYDKQGNMYVWSVLNGTQSQMERAIGLKFNVEADKLNANYQLKAATDTQEFKKWFKDSKVVDENGNPLVVYHGTIQKFSQFRRGDIGFHFGNKDQANIIIEGESNANVIESYLNLQNPLVVNYDLGNWNSGYMFTDRLLEDGVITEQEHTEVNTLNYGEGYSSKGNKTLRNILLSKGYDGVIYENQFESDGISYIAFNPTQIKSIYNNGTFNEYDPNINYQLKAEEGEYNIVRVDAEGKSIKPSDKPQGLYVSFTDDVDTFNSPHEVGEIKYTGIAKPKNVLVLKDAKVKHARFGSSERGYASAGVLALKEMLPETRFNELLGYSKSQMLELLNAEYPGPDYNLYYDAYELLEAYSGQLARDKGYDALELEDKDFPEMNELVILSDDVMELNGPNNKIMTDGEVNYQLRELPPPINTIKAYKLLRVMKNQPGKLFPLFVDATNDTPIGAWLDAEVGETTTDDKGNTKVKSKLGNLAFRPGWHLGDIPLATHIGVKGESGKIEYMNSQHVWVESEVAADVNYQEQANKNGINPKTGKINAVKADIKELPTDGYYRYKTNPNMTGEWIITGSMKINRILSDEEAATIVRNAGYEPLPREGGDINLNDYGLSLDTLLPDTNLQLKAADDSISQYSLDTPSISHNAFIKGNLITPLQYKENILQGGYKVLEVDKVIEGDIYNLVVKDAVMGGYDYLKMAGNEPVVISNEMIEKVLSEKPLFQLKEVEGQGNLLAMHNITEGKLKSALKLGGFPMASLAVAKVDQPLSNFGEITLLFKKDTIDPKRTTNKVFGADVYSPRFPSPKYKMINNNEVWGKFRAAEKQSGLSLYQLEADFSMGRSVHGDRLMKYTYMNEKGIELDFTSANDIWDRHRIVDDAFNSNNFYDDEYRSWADNQLEQGTKPVFWDRKANKEIPMTLDNALKLMKREEVRGGEGGQYSGALRALATREFTSIKDIKANTDLIVDSDTFEEAKADAEYMQGEAEQILKKYSNYSRMYDEVYSMLNNYFKYGSGIEAMQKGLNAIDSKMYGNMEVGDITKLVEYADWLRNMPTEYFEAKLRRIVGINEIQAVIATEDISAELEQMLKDKGINLIEKYTDNRQQAIDNVLRQNDVSFQLKIDTNTNEFKDWFKDSVVVDREGNPKVMYHGTQNGGFAAFNSEASHKDREGIFFTNNFGMARSYSGSNDIIQREYNFKSLGDVETFLDKSNMDVYEEDGKIIVYGYKEYSYETLDELVKAIPSILASESRTESIYETYLSIQNPYIIEGNKRSWDDLDGMNTNEWVSKISSEGVYDGIIFKNIYDTATEWEYQGVSDVTVVFDPNQIKSVNNYGTWNVNDANIYYQLKEGPEIRERSWGQTVRDVSLTTPWLSELLLSNKFFYEVKHNEDTLIAAAQFIDKKGEEYVEARLLSNLDNDAILMAASQIMTYKYMENGETDRAMSMLDKTAEKATSLGQAIQILSVWGRNTPEGMLRYTSNAFRGATTDKDKQDILLKVKALTEAFNNVNRDSLKDIDLVGTIQQVKDIPLIERTARQLTSTDEGQKLIDKYGIEVLLGNRSQMDQVDQETLAPFINTDNNIDDAMGQKIIDLVNKHFEEGGKGKLKTKLAELGLNDFEVEILDKYIKSKVTEATKNKKQQLIDKELSKKKYERKGLDQKIIELTSDGVDENALRNLIGEKEGMPVLTKELVDYIYTQGQYINTLEPGRKKDVETAKLIKEITDHMPVNMWSKINTFRVMAMLLNAKTTIRNIVGNEMFRRLDTFALNFIGAPIDMALSMATGQRTMLFRPIAADKAQMRGYLEGWRLGLEDALLGINTSNAETQFDFKTTRTFKSGILGGAETVMNIALRATDRAALMATFMDSLEEQMQIANIDVATEVMVDRAMQLALYRTFQDTTVLSEMFSGLKKNMNRIGFGLEPGQKITDPKKFGTGDLFMPFPKTPANIMGRAIDYSPVGLVMTMFKLSAESDRYMKQRMVTEGLSRAIMGTGMIAIGAMLAKMGILTGSNPEDEEDIYLLKKAHGLRDFSINISAIGRHFLSGFTDARAGELKKGDTIASYDWAQPISMALAIGADTEIGGTDAKDIISTVVRAWETGVTTLTDQPLLTGVANLFRYGDPAEGFSKAMLDLPSSFTPTLFSHVAQFIDGRDTDPYKFYEGSRAVASKVMNKVPGLRGNIPSRYTSLGNEKRYYPVDNNLVVRALNTFLNPAITGKYMPTKEAEFIFDLYESSGDPDIVPKAPQKQYTIDKVKYSFDPESWAKMSKWLGARYKTEINNVMGYMQGSSPEEQADEIKFIIKEIKEEAREKVLELGTVVK